MLCLDPLGQPGDLETAARGKNILCLSGVTPAYARTTGAALSLNTDLALAAIRAAEPGRRVFLASSAAVYGAQGGLLDETQPCTPTAPYGAAKLEMENAARHLGAARGVGVTSLRIGNVAGADAILGGWTDGMALDTGATGQTPKRSYIGPHTFADVVAALLDAQDLPDCLNLSAPGAVEMGALLDAAGLPWSRRMPADAVIWDVTLATVRLSRYFAFDPVQSTAPGLVSEWRAMQGSTKWS